MIASDDPSSDGGCPVLVVVVWYRWWLPDTDGGYPIPMVVIRYWWFGLLDAVTPSGSHDPEGVTASNNPPDTKPDTAPDTKPDYPPDTKPDTPTDTRPG